MICELRFNKAVPKKILQAASHRGDGGGGGGHMRRLDWGSRERVPGKPAQRVGDRPAGPALKRDRTLDADCTPPTGWSRGKLRVDVMTEARSEEESTNPGGRRSSRSVRERQPEPFRALRSEISAHLVLIQPNVGQPQGVVCHGVLAFGRAIRSSFPEDVSNSRARDDEEFTSTHPNLGRSKTYVNGRLAVP